MEGYEVKFIQTFCLNDEYFLHYNIKYGVKYIVFYGQNLRVIIIIQSKTL